MRVEDACALLARHNEWRRGGDAEMESPKLLGLAIDTVVAAAMESNRLRAAIRQTLNENGHLADGDNCTLIVLKRAVGDWIEARNAPVTGMFGIAERDALINAENALENSFDALVCKKCGGGMQQGQAIAQTFTGSPDFIGGEVCTVSPGGPGKLVECSKCPACGWSVTA